MPQTREKRDQCFLGRSRKTRAAQNLFCPETEVELSPLPANGLAGCLSLSLCTFRFIKRRFVFSSVPAEVRLPPSSVSMPAIFFPLIDSSAGNDVNSVLERSWKRNFFLSIFASGTRRASVDKGRENKKPKMLGPIYFYGHDVLGYRPLLISL